MKNIIFKIIPLVFMGYSSVFAQSDQSDNSKVFLQTVDVDNASVNNLLDGFVVVSEIKLSNPVLFEKKNFQFEFREYPKIRNESTPPKRLFGENSLGLESILPFSEPQKLYYDLLSSITKEALYLENKKNFVYKVDSASSTIEGLKYVWGGKEINELKTSLDGCPKVYGLDCSGFIYQLFKRSGINIPKVNADSLRKPETLKKFLIPYFGDSSVFSVDTLEGLGVKDIHSGDLIYFRNTSGRVCHIGLCLKTIGGELYFFESSGDKGNCILNMSEKRGVRMLEISTKLESDKRMYGIVRINVKGI